VKIKYQRSIKETRSDNSKTTVQSQQEKIASTNTITITARRNPQGYCRKEKKNIQKQKHPRKPEDSSRNSMQMWGGARNKLIESWGMSRSKFNFQINTSASMMTAMK
jgi:hypothetical protein